MDIGRGLLKDGLGGAGSVLERRRKVDREQVRIARRLRNKTTITLN